MKRKLNHSQILWLILNSHNIQNEFEGRIWFIAAEKKLDYFTYLLPQNLLISVFWWFNLMCRFILGTLCSLKENTSYIFLKNCFLINWSERAIKLNNMTIHSQLIYLNCSFLQFEVFIANPFVSSCETSP